MKHFKSSVTHEALSEQQSAFGPLFIEHLTSSETLYHLLTTCYYYYNTVEPRITSIIRSRIMLVIQCTCISKWVFPLKSMETKIICSALTSMGCNTACGQRRGKGPKTRRLTSANVGKARKLSISVSFQALPNGGERLRSSLFASGAPPHVRPSGTAGPIRLNSACLARQHLQTVRIFFKKLLANQTALKPSYS